MKKYIILAFIIFLYPSCNAFRDIKQYSYHEDLVMPKNENQYVIDQLFVKIERTSLWGIFNNKLNVKIYISLIYITPNYTLESFVLEKKPNRKLSTSEKENIKKNDDFNDEILNNCEIEPYELIPVFNKTEDFSHEYYYNEPSYSQIEFDIEKMAPWGIDIIEIKIKDKKQLVYQGLDK